MSRVVSPRVGVYAWLVAGALLAALASRRPEPVALAAPFALALVVGAARAAPPELDASVAVERQRLVEGDEIEAAVEVWSSTGADRVEVRLVLPAGLAAIDRAAGWAFPLRPGERQTLRVRLRAARWGAHPIGELIATARPGVGLFATQARLDRRVELRVYPRPEVLRTLVRPAATQPLTGHRTARHPGSGIEFADTRPYVPGDPARDVNRRLSARRGALWVTQRHPERNTDVVVLLDAFSGTALPAAVRAASALVSAHLDQRDRVGLVSFGGFLGWVEPATGLRQHYRIVDALLASQAVFSYAWKAIATIPPRALPPGALVLAVSSLEDERTLAALADLRGRGRDVAVVEVSPEAYTPARPGEAGELAHRLWRLRREVLRARYRALGVGVVPWREGVALQAVLEELSAFRRRVRYAAG